MQENDKLNPEELQAPKLATLPTLPETEELEKKSPEELEALSADLQEQLGKLEDEDLDVKNYLKVSPTFYIKAVENEDEEDETELFQILNPETQTVETRELTDDEKKELFVQQLKHSRKVFNPLSHPTKTVGTSVVVSSIGRERQIKEKELQTNVTVNQFNKKYKQKRKRKNKLAKASRKANR